MFIENICIRSPKEPERPTALLVQTVPAILALPLLITNRGATNTVSSQGKRITQISS